MSRKLLFAAIVAELAALADADQADRRLVGSSKLAWNDLAQHDLARENQVIALYSSGALRTGGDSFNAALVLQHSEDPEMHLLAHELSVVAIIKGDVQARWLAAATEDRFLTKIGRPQRFGTQMRREAADQPMNLYETDPIVTDSMRRQFNVPPLNGTR